MKYYIFGLLKCSCNKRLNTLISSAAILLLSPAQVNAFSPAVSPHEKNVSQKNSTVKSTSSKDVLLNFSSGPVSQNHHGISAITVTGKVVDENGLAIPGASIKVKGTNQAALTDSEGNFTLKNVEENAVLMISFIGYESQEVKAAQTLRISLSPSSVMLNNIVVVGYGTQKKATVTSSVSQITRSEINSTPGASLQNMLTGKITGLSTLQRSGQPGNDAAQIFVRGVSTLPGINTNPLILVDNIKYDFTQFSQIDQNEIETISILKDAASTSIYGIEGANGVILVTTRRGKAGKANINLRSELGINVPVRRFQSLDSYNAGLLLNEARINDGLQPQFTQQDLDLFRSGEDPYGHPNVNWYDVIYDNKALQTDHNFDISGGTDRFKYFTTVGYLYQDGLFNKIEYKGPARVPDRSDINNDYYFKRYKFRSNIDLNATNSLKFSLDFTGTFAETNSPNVGNLFFAMTQYEYVNPYAYPLYNPDGSFGFANRAFFEPRDKVNNLGAVASLSGYNRDYNNFFSTNFTGEQKLDALTKGLSFKGVFSYSGNNTSRRTLSRGSIPSFYYNPADGSYTPKDPDVYRVSPLSLGSSGGTPSRIITYQAILNYNRTFGDHSASALLLYNRSSDINKDVNFVPDNFMGYTFRGSYNFKQKYMFEFSGAYNGSSRFISQKRYTLFPAVSAGWNIANENFVKNSLPFINTFKFRGSYGYSGNKDVKDGYAYYYESFYLQGLNYNFGESPNNFNGIYEGKLGNDQVSWATERKANLGLDFSLFNGKFSGSVDYFDNYRYDILYDRRTIPATYGVPTGILPPVNLGRVANKGYEFELSHKSKIGQLGYNLKANFSYAKNKIVFVDEPAVDPSKPWLSSTGRPVGTTKQYIWTGQFYNKDDINNAEVAKPAGSVKEGWLKYQDLDGNGIINQDDMAYTGNPNVPNTVIGLTIGFDYKGFNISGLLQSNLNGEAFTGFDMAVPFKTQLQSLHQNRWTPETASTATFPALTTNFAGTYMNPNGNMSTFWATPTDFLRLRSAEMGYRFPQSFANKLGLAGIRLYANAYNLFTITNFYKRYQFDPEITKDLNTMSYPTTKLINTGLALTFK